MIVHRDTDRSFARHPLIVAAAALFACLITSEYISAKSTTPFAQETTSQSLCAENAGGLDLRQLKPNIAVPREISGGNNHYYKFEVRGKAYAHAVVDQLGIDVRVYVLTCGSDGKPGVVTEVDRQSGSHGPEAISFVTEDAGGIYFLKVEAFQASDPRGRYSVQLFNARTPRAQDLVRIKAEQTVTKGGDYYTAALNENQPRDVRRKYLEDSVREFEQARQLWRSLHEPYEEAITLYGIGYCYSDMGALGTVKFPLPAGRLRWSYQSRGEHQKAIDVFEESFAYMKRTGDKYGQAITKAGVAWPKLYLGREKEALQDFSDAVELFHSIKNTKGEGRALYGKGWANALAGDNEKALDYFRQSLPLRRTSGEVIGAANTQGSICRIFNRLQKNKEAIDSCSEALDGFKGRRHGTASTRTVRGFAYIALGQYDKALDDFQEALKLRIGLKDDTGAANSRYGMARVLRQQNRLKEALDQMDEVLKIVEPMRSSGSSEELRTYFFANVQEYYDLYIDLLMSLGHETLALDASERARGRELLATLAETEKDSAKLDPSLTQPLKFDEIRNLLDGDTLLLEIALGENRSFGWLVSDHGMHSYPLPKSSELETKALELHRLLMTPPPKAATELKRVTAGHSQEQANTLATELGRVLFGKITEFLGNKRLVIVAPGALQYIPFSTLYIPSNAAEPPSLLGERHEVVVLPSASILSALRHRLDKRPPLSRTVAILADPVFNASDLRVQVKGGKHISRSPRLRGCTEGPVAAGEKHGVELACTPTKDLDLPRLEASRWEAEQIAALADNGLLALDFNASRNKALSGELKLDQYRIIHFATHALIDDVNPPQSRIALSNVDERGRLQNGSLTLQDIDQLHLPADLIVLSACRTGLGKRIKGEGLKGLTSGFMHAGASRIIVSLWPVDDDAAAEFMVIFYRKLWNKQTHRLEPGSAAKALREAQTEMRQHTNWKSPYYWAPFLLQGDWR